MDSLKRTTYYALITVWVFASSCTSKKGIPVEEFKIAVIADVHLQDVYGTLEDTDYAGLRNPKNGKYALIRTMGSQLRSTRIFNENYFAFLAALDDVVKRNVKHVILPGDFSDDGQPLHIRGLKRILSQYTKLHGISFFLITGNHDVVQPYDHVDGKHDFLGEDGKPQPILSHSALYKSDASMAHPAVITSDIQNLGYTGITRLLADFGFFPQKSNLYWESPFSDYSYDTYNFQDAKKSASLDNRSYLIAKNDVPLPDISYLVEPVNGLWLLALDANTYLKKEIKPNDSKFSQEYPNTGLGLDNLLKSKKYLIDWVQKVVQEAEKRGKTLIAFSHYPMVDFNNMASNHIDNLLVGSKMQLQRVPDENVARVFADAGLKVHFGGHMHMNDTGISTTKNGNTLVNIQAPSLAAYVPAYKLLTIKKNKLMDVQTIVIDSVPRFDEFFELYEQEHKYLESMGYEDIWDKDILSSKNYHEFITWHLKELVRLRFLAAEWPSNFADFLLSISGEDLLVLSQLGSNLSYTEVLKSSKKYALIKVKKDGVDPMQFSKWTGFDLLFDLYRLRSADELALKDIGRVRLSQYTFIINSFLNQEPLLLKNDLMKRNMVELMTLLKKFLNGAPSDHFQVDLNKGTVRSLKIEKTD